MFTKKLDKSPPCIHTQSRNWVAGLFQAGCSPVHKTKMKNWNLLDLLALAEYNLDASNFADFVQIVSSAYRYSRGAVVVYGLNTASYNVTLIFDGRLINSKKHLYWLYPYGHSRLKSE